MSELTIYPKFKDLIPPLTPEEYAGLEASLLEEGCRDAILVWKKDEEISKCPICGCDDIFITQEEDLSMDMIDAMYDNPRIAENFTHVAFCDRCDKVVIENDFDFKSGIGYYINYLPGWEKKIGKQSKIIIDGHNRYDICTKHNIEFETKEISFDNEEDAEEWFYQNQRQPIYKFINNER